VDKISSTAFPRKLSESLSAYKELPYMRRPAKQTMMNQPEQRLLSCGFEESLRMTADVFNGSEQLTGYSSMNEQLKRQPKKTYR
jgi:hypothetical protein